MILLFIGCLPFGCIKINHGSNVHFLKSYVRWVFPVFITFSSNFLVFLLVRKNEVTKKGVNMKRVLAMHKWAYFLVFLTILNTSAPSILNSKLQFGSKEIEFAVLAENREAVMEFCQGKGCTYVGQVIFFQTTGVHF